MQPNDPKLSHGANNCKREFANNPPNEGAAAVGSIARLCENADIVETFTPVDGLNQA